MAQLDALPYRMYLLAYDLDRRRLFDRTRTAFLTRAAAVTELALRGSLTADSHPAAAAGATGDPVLDQVLAEAGERDGGWKALLRRNYRPTLDAVERQLEAAGVITVRRRRVLGLLSRRETGLPDPAAVAAAQRHFAQVVQGSEPAVSISDADAALVALAAGGRARTVLSRRDRQGHAARVEELAGRLAAIAPGLADAVRGLERTIVAAQGGMGGS
jgi:hypothetical protein